MSHYVIGDVQGCFHTFIKLLEKISFNTKSDQLWLVGDIINRGKVGDRVSATLAADLDRFSRGNINVG